MILDKQRRLATATLAYGVLTVASGVYNRLVDHGTHGLWFGLVFGGLALVGAVLLHCGQTRLGAAFALAALGFIGGWFVFETFVDKGGVASPRHYLMVVASLAYGWILLRTRSAAP